MGICYWCYWGWPKPIMEIFKAAVENLGGNDSAMLYGPAHIVWEDENWDSAQWCLDNFESWKSQFNESRFSDEQLEVVRQSLVDLVAVDDSFKRAPEGFEDDDGRPDLYPPPASWEMIRQ